MLVTLWVCSAMFVSTLLGAPDGFLHADAVDHIDTKFLDTCITGSALSQQEVYDGWYTVALVGGVVACVLISIGAYLYLTNRFKQIKDNAHHEYVHAHEQLLRDLSDKHDRHQAACAAIAQEHADRLRTLLAQNASTTTAALEKKCQDQQRALEQEHARQQAFITSLAGHHTTINADQKARLDQAAREHLGQVTAQIGLLEQALHAAQKSHTSDYAATLQQLEKLSTLAGTTMAENTASMHKQHEECVRLNNETSQKLQTVDRKLNQQIDTVKKICEDFIRQAPS